MADAVHDLVDLAAVILLALVVRYASAYALLAKDHTLITSSDRQDSSERTETAFEEAWDKEHDTRTALINQVKRLADLPHPPRESWRPGRVRQDGGKEPAGGVGRDG
jgi:hypothetical protein